MAKPELTAEEERLIARYKRAYWRLEFGKTEVSTPARRHFVAVCRGEAQPETAHEVAWTKFKELEMKRAEEMRNREIEAIHEAADRQNQKMDIAEREDGVPNDSWAGPTDWKTPSYLGR